MPKISLKAYLIIGIVLLFAALVWLIWHQQNIIDRQRRIEQSTIEMRQLQDGIVRNKARYVTGQQLKDFAKQTDVNLKQIQKDAKKLGADVQSISEAKTVTPGFIKTLIQSSSSTPRTDPPEKIETKCPDGTSVTCPNPDKFGYLGKTEKLALKEPFADGTKVPWGEVGFSAWQQKPWQLKVYPRKYSAVTVMAQDEDGRHFAYSKFSIESEGEKHSIPIEAELVEKIPEPEFRFNPRLYLSIGVGTYFNPRPDWEITPNLQVFLFSHGHTKITPKWIFLGVGAGYGTQMNKLNFILSPVSYNIGKHIPLVDNIYIGPSVGLDTSGSFSILGGLRVGL